MTFPAPVPFGQPLVSSEPVPGVPFAAVVLLLPYSNPSAKAPEIHPGDEAPFLYGVMGRRVRSAA